MWFGIWELSVEVDITAGKGLCLLDEKMKIRNFWLSIEIDYNKKTSSQLFGRYEPRSI